MLEDLLKGNKNLLIAGIAGIFIIGIAVTFAGVSKNPTEDSGDIIDPGTGAAEEVLPEADMIIDISGAVIRPGVYRLPCGSRAINAVEAAGGLLPYSKTQEINFAEKLKDGQKLRVPFNDLSVQGAATPAGAGKVNINSADITALDSLPGIGPAMAKKILDHRTSKGQFDKLEGLMEVPGIGKSKFEKLKDKVCL